MKKETLSEQVRAARGNRSVREYARESGVDASIISRIENGSYTPGVKIIKRLTSPEANPQGKITYEGLIEAADGDAKYKKGVKSGLAAAVSGLSGLATANLLPLAVTGLPGLTAALSMLAVGNVASIAMDLSQKNSQNLVKEEKENLENDISKYKNWNQEIQRFTATATGIILGKLAEKRLAFRFTTKDDSEMPLYETDIRLTLEEEQLDSWVFCFVGTSLQDNSLDIFAKQATTRMFERFFFWPSNPRRKVSIVVNDTELFNHLMKYQGKNSYKGNMSVILIDVNRVIVEKEEYLSFYGLEKTGDKFLLETNHD